MSMHALASRNLVTVPIPTPGEAGLGLRAMSLEPGTLDFSFQLLREPPVGTLEEYSQSGQAQIDRTETGLSVACDPLRIPSLQRCISAAGIFVRAASDGATRLGILLGGDSLRQSNGAYRVDLTVLPRSELEMDLYGIRFWGIDPIDLAAAGVSAAMGVFVKEQQGRLPEITGVRVRGAHPPIPLTRSL